MMTFSFRRTSSVLRLDNSSSTIKMRMIMVPCSGACVLWTVTLNGPIVTIGWGSCFREVYRECSSSRFYCQ